MLATFNFFIIYYSKPLTLVTAVLLKMTIMNISSRLSRITVYNVMNVVYQFIRGQGVIF